MSLVRMISNDNLVAKERADEATENSRLKEQIQHGLSGHIRRHWDINRVAKEEVEEIMLQSLRQRNGMYDPDVKAEIRATGGSQIYMGITATKCRAACSWITDILLPAGEKAWELEPTPIPALPPHIRQNATAYLRQEIQRAMQQGGQMPPEEEMQARLEDYEDQVLQYITEQSEESTEKMETLIEDQFAEGGFNDALVEFIDDFVTFPAAIMKGPVMVKRKKLSWGPNGEPVVTDEIVTRDYRVSPFDCFPSPGAQTPQDGTFIERLTYTPEELYGYIGLEGYSEDAITAVLAEHGEGGLRDWTTHWDQQRDDAEGKRNTYLTSTNEIQGLHYWGAAKGLDLLEWGMEIDDPLGWYEIEAILIGRHVILARRNSDPLNDRPYRKACFQNNPGSFWGQAPPQLMRDIQRMCNGIGRAIANNMGLASGPMMWVLVDRLADGEEITQFQPLKTMQMTSDPSGNNIPPVQFFQPDSNAGELLAVYNTFEEKADDATNVPRYAYGNERMAGAGSTAQGLAMLMESATKGIKQAIRNIDYGVIMPRLKRQYRDNMLYIQDPSVKGDMQVVVRGSTSLVAKAATQARRNEFLAITGNDFDMSLIGPEGRTALLRAMAKEMDLPDIVPSVEEMKMRAEKQEEQGPPPDPQMQVEQMRAEREMAILERKMQDADADRQLKVQLAQMALEGDMMELAGKRELTLEQIKAKLGETSIRERGQNDRFVAERQIKAQYGSGI